MRKGFQTTTTTTNRTLNSDTNTEKQAINGTSYPTLQQNWESISTAYRELKTTFEGNGLGLVFSQVVLALTKTPMPEGVTEDERWMAARTALTAGMAARFAIGMELLDALLDIRDELV